MNQEKQYWQSTTDRFIPKSEVNQETLSLLVREAIVGHLKWHSNDGLSLYVIGVTHPDKSIRGIVPVSAVDYNIALAIAQEAVEESYPKDSEWHCLFQYPDLIRQ
jgi:hypothetical protein